MMGNEQRYRAEMAARLMALEEDEWHVLVMRCAISPHSLDETAEALRITRERVRQIEHEALGYLAGHAGSRREDDGCA